MTGLIGKKILLVDYEVSKMKATEDFLSQAGFEVVKAFDGLDALEKFSEEHPDLVLLSAMLPKLHGFEVCKAIKHSDRGRQTPVLITTSVYKSYKYKRQAMKDYLADDYILKPFNYEELLAKIREHLGLEMMPDDATVETKELKAPTDGDLKKIDGEFASMLDQTLDNLLNKPQEKEKSAAKSSHASVEPDNLDDILESTLSGLMDEIGKNKTVSKPTPKKVPESERPSKAIQPQESVAPDEQLKGDAQREEEFDILPDFELEEPLPAPEEPLLEEIALEESSVEIAFTEDKAPLPISGPDESTIKTSETSGSEPEKVSDKEQLDKIIDEAIAIFGEDIEEGVKQTADVSAEKIEAAPVKAEVSSEPVTPEIEPDDESWFGKYKLIEKIAVGGMAELWKAKQVGPEGFEKVVALKRILPSLSENEDFITMFIDEGKVAAQLTHPNIAQIYELGETKGNYYLAMEYIAGKDLRTIMRLARKEKKHLAVSQAALIAIKLLSGLNYAHRKKGFNNENLNIVHRDVSPQNVLISYEGEVKLVDFGIAKAAAKNSITLTGALKGKILYMSPEQAWGQSVDRRSDIFSVGTLLYEMLTGKRVFIADNEMAILQKVRDWNPPRPSDLNAQISSMLDAIIQKAMEKDPDNRYQTADEMKEDLDRFLQIEKPPKKLMDLGFFMRALFKDEIKAEMPELLDDSIESIDPFALELAKTPATGPTLETQAPITTPTEPEKADAEEPARIESEQIVAESPIAKDDEAQKPAPIDTESKALESESVVTEPVDRSLVPTAASVDSHPKRQKGRKRSGPKPSVKTPAAISEKPEEADTEKKVEPPEIVIDDDFLKPSRSSFFDRKKLPFIAGGAGIIIIIILILVFSGGKKETKPIPAVLPTPTVDYEATAIAEETVEEEEALFTETPSPTPTDTPTPLPAIPVTRDTPVSTPVPTETPLPTDTPIPTETPTPTATPTATQTPIQEGAYIQHPDVKPEPLTKVTPEMPRAARQMGVDGRVTLKVLISETGEVLDVETLSFTSDQLQKSGCVKAAEDAVKKWTFKPGTHQNVPIRTHLNLVIPFKSK